MPDGLRMLFTSLNKWVNKVVNNLRTLKNTKSDRVARLT